MLSVSLLMTARLTARAREYSSICHAYTIDTRITRSGRLLETTVFGQPMANMLLSWMQMTIGGLPNSSIKSSCFPGRRNLALSILRFSLLTRKEHSYVIGSVQGSRGQSLDLTRSGAAR